MTRGFIAACNHRCWTVMCQELNLNPNEYVFVTHIEQMMGAARDLPLILCDNFRHYNNAMRVYEEAVNYGRRVWQFTRVT